MNVGEYSIALLLSEGEYSLERFINKSLKTMTTSQAVFWFWQKNLLDIAWMELATKVPE